MGKSSDVPDLSLVVPCYNEADALGSTVPPLFAAIASAVQRCEMILVDNGSTDSTGRLITQLSESDPRIRTAAVPVNRGYGLGVLTGYRVARGRCIGHIPADGPVTPDDVAMLALRALAEGPGALVTAVRLGRQETLSRKLVSRAYNALFFLMFGRYTSDINGTPKFVHRTDLARMGLASQDYFLEAEMMIKARRLGMRTVPVTVPSQARPGGASKVSARLLMACLEFLRNLVRARFGRLGNSGGVGVERHGDEQSPAVRSTE